MVSQCSDRFVHENFFFIILLSIIVICTATYVQFRKYYLQLRVQLHTTNCLLGTISQKLSDIENQIDYNQEIYSTRDQSSAIIVPSNSASPTSSASIWFLHFPPNLLPFQQGDTVKIINLRDNLHGISGILITIDQGWVYFSTATRVIKRSISCFDWVYLYSNFFGYSCWVA